MEKISNTKELDNIVLTFGDSIDVCDRDTKTQIPGVTRREFSFSCPYFVGENGNVVLAKPWGRSFFFMKQGMDQHTAMDLFRSYLNHNTHGNRVSLTNVSPAIYEKPEPSLNGGLLNTFRVTGHLYSVDTKNFR